MAENLFCEEANCGEPAQVFGFVGRIKQKACQEHSLLLINKRITLYSIAAFAFMQSPEDAALYEQRRGQMQRGLGAVTALETACEANWEEEQKRMHERCEATHEVVQQTYQEMWLRSQQTYQQVKRDLADLRNQFEQLIVDHHIQLSPEVADLCEEMPPDRLFCVAAGDTRISVAESLMADYKVLVWDVKQEKKRNWGAELRQFANNQAAANRFDIAVTVAEHASLLGAEGSDFANEAIQQSEEATQQLRCLLSTSTITEAEECLKAGQSADKTGEWETGITELQRGRDLLRGSSHLELYLKLSCKMAEIHFQRGNYEETVEVCEHILSTWTSSAHSLEFLQALFYLMYSYVELKEYSQALAIGEEWSNKLIVECSACQCVQMHTLGLMYCLRDREEEGREYLERALQFDNSPFLISLYSNILFAAIYEKQGQLEKSEQTFRSACELGTTHFPHSIQYAGCLSNLGVVYQKMQRLQEAEEQYMKGIQLCSTHFPHYIEKAKCLSNLGLVYKGMKRLQEAEEQWMKGIQLCSTHFPHSIEYAQCLLNLGVLYGSTGRGREAVICAEKARTLYVRLGAQDDVSNCDRLFELLRRDYNA